MLRRTSSIKGYSIQATDGELGKVKEVYFDDEQWGIRYLVIETGSWLSRRAVLISPIAIQSIDDTDELIRVSLTMDQVKNSPDIDTHQPVSRQLEGEFSDYYGYGNYWSGPYLWGAAGYPALTMPESVAVPPIEDRPDQLAARAIDNPEDTHLRSSANVEGYHIGGTDGEIGHVDDFVFDDQAWAIRYFLVDTRNWWPGGKKVLLAADWIEHIDWTDATVQTRMTRDQIKQSPEYDSSTDIDRDYEVRLHRHYERQGYWD